MQEDHAFEVSQSRRVQAARAALTQSLGLDKSQLRRPLEDMATAAIEATPNRADKVELGRLRDAYITEVNRFWLYAENAGITARLCGAWMKANRRGLNGVDRADYSAEATFAMRAAVTLFEGREGGAPLVSYAFMHVSGACNAIRNAAVEFHSAVKYECDSRVPEGLGVPEGTAPIGAEMIDDVTPETVLIAKREMQRLGLIKKDE